MRILMLAPHPGVRGPIPKHTPVLVNALRSLGCDVAFEPWGRHHDRESTTDKMIGRTLDIPRIQRRVKSQRFDVMVVKTSHEARSLLRDVPLLTATRRLVPKLVVQFHGGRSDLLIAPGHHAFKAASAVVFALSDGILLLSTEEARESHCFWPRGRFRVVSNAFLPTPQNSAATHPSNGGNESPLSLLFVGRLITEKGVFETLDAFATLSDRHECRIVMVGDGPQAEAIARRASELGIAHKVILKGFLEGDPLLNAYQTADIFVFPSYREGFPTAVTEAMAAGLPVVTTRTRGMADHLVHTKNALLVSPGDSRELAAALETIASDAALRQRMSAANVAKVGDFAPAVVARHYLETLQELVRC